MKTKITIALLVLAAAFCLNSCVVRGSTKLPVYELILEVVDQNGENVISDAGRDIELSVEARYTLNNEISNDNVFTKVENGNLTLRVVLGQYEHRDQPKVTWKIKCFEVFGDQETHTIESDWVDDGNWVRSCSEIVFEGKQYAVSTNGNARNYARVVVNR